jgi:CheY-like chemotaxis protein
MIDMHPPPRILAIEPDPQSGTALYLALDKWVCADVLIVDNIDAALTSIAEQVPDLILTSTFLPPATLARLNDELRRLPDATHTLIITTPHLLDDAVLLGAQVEHYLAQARSLHEAAQARQQRGLVPITDLVLVARPPDPWQDSIGSSSRGSGRPMGTQAQSGRRRQDRGHLMLGGAPRDEHQAPAGEPD